MNELKADSLFKPVLVLPDTIVRSDTINNFENSNIDTTAISSNDTTIVTTKLPDSLNPLAKERTVIEDIIERTARDSIVQDLVNKKVYLYGDAVVTYQEIILKAAYIEVDFNTNSLYATGLPDSSGKLTGFPEFSESGETFKAKTMTYNFRTKEGIIHNVLTQDDLGFLHGKKVKKMEDNSEDHYDGFDNSTESYIELNLYQDENREQSEVLAYNVQQQFKNRVGRKDRGVKEAGFLVLWRTSVPGILIELGFLSNPKEEQFLNSEEGQVFMASAIYRAFKEYKITYEKENAVVEPITYQANTDLDYRIQFYTNPKELSLSDNMFRGINKLAIYYHNGLYKYTSGHFSNLQKANEQLVEIRKKGFNDAFIVVFNNDMRITSDEAKRSESER